MNESKTFPLDVSRDDNVSDMVKRIPDGGDMYVTSDRRVLRGSDELRSCGVRDGSTVQVGSSLRGGGRDKSKTPGGGKKNLPQKRNTTEKGPPEANAVFEMFDRCSRTGMGGWSAEKMEAMLEQTERRLSMLRGGFPEEVGNDPERVIEGIKRFLQERRRKEKDQQEEDKRSGGATTAEARGGSERQNRSSVRDCVSERRNSQRRRERKALTNVKKRVVLRR